MIGVYRGDFLTNEQREFFKKYDVFYSDRVKAWVANDNNPNIEYLKDALRRNKTTWKLLLDNKFNNVFYLYKLLELGLPFDKEQRVELYKNFYKRGPYQYPIELGGLLSVFPEFREVYDLSALYEKLPEILNSEGGYKKAIKDTVILTKEEKYFILLAFPLQDKTIELLSALTKQNENEEYVKE